MRHFVKDFVCFWCSILLWKRNVMIKSKFYCAMIFLLRFRISDADQDLCDGSSYRLHHHDYCLHHHHHGGPAGLRQGESVGPVAVCGGAAAAGGGAVLCLCSEYIIEIESLSLPYYRDHDHYHRRRRRHYPCRSTFIVAEFFILSSPLPSTSSFYDRGGDD